MVDVNAPSGQAPAMAPPVRTDDQILPHIRWVPIRKSNCYLDLEKSQGNPIYKFAVDLLKNTNFFKAFTASSTIPSIYIQQFWDTILYDKKAGCYRCQLDEQLVVLTKYTLREALQIILVNNNQAFAAPPSSDGLINFVNKLGYPMFHPRPGSLLHLPNEEPVLGYLKFSAKGTKREVFGMPIPGSLITAKIQEASYNQEYLAKVAQHRRYLAGETGDVQDPPASKPTQPARKPKSTTTKAPPRPVVTSTQPAPTSTPAKPQEKKRKQAIETSDKPPKAKKSKHSRVGKIRSLKSVAASKAEDVPAMEAHVVAEDTDFQKALEESMKTAYALPRGPLPPVVIREPELVKYQPLPEVPGKGKAKVTEEEVAHDLMSLQKHKKTSLTDQYIFQRRVSEPTESSGHDESPYTLPGQSDSEEESEKVMLGADEGGQDEGQVRPDPGAQAEDQTGSDTGAQDEGQAESNPDETSEGQARPDPGDAGAKAQSIPSPVVHAGSDREHMDLDVADVSPQPSTEQLDEGFTATAYSKVQENLKLAVEEHVLLEDPASSSGTISSLQHLSKDISFGDLLFNDRPLDVDKNTETEVESMAMMVKRIGKLEHIMANLIQVNKDMEERLGKHGARLYTLDQLDIPQHVSIAVSEVVTDVVDWAMQAPLRNRFRDLPEADMKEILHQRMWETESYKSHEDHMQLFEALEKSMNCDHSEELAQDLAEARKKKKQSRESPKTPPGSPSHQPPPPPPLAGPSRASEAPGASRSSQVPPSPPPPSSTNQESPSKGSTAPSSSKTATSAEYQAWTTTDIRLRPSISLTPADLEMDEDMALDEQAQLSNDEDIGSAHIPTVNLSVDGPILRHNVSKPLPLGGPPGQVTIQSDFFFNKDLEYLRYGSKGHRPALSISKMKAAYYLDAGLEQMVPDQFWIKEECKYDITAIAVKTHMRILSVIRIKVFSMYGYDYMKKIVLRCANLNEYVIAERDFKYLYLTNDEALGYRFKEFIINKMNPCLNTRFWTKKDVDRSKAFMFAIKRRLKTRRIFRNLESFVGGRVREGDYRLLKRTE
uniref:E-beta-farnesene synthase n=1 Tax=Tanacetum cinerariifolium TaxID=118510 RepID=A0A6L2J8Z0_TANCI|nr:E-beta-farnesene synthase [Tanacetum cinerariifolium]